MTSILRVNTSVTLALLSLGVFVCVLSVAQLLLSLEHGHLAGRVHGSLLIYYSVPKDQKRRRKKERRKKKKDG